jgi:hypothetical protein
MRTTKNYNNKFTQKDKINLHASIDICSFKMQREA